MDPSRSIKYLLQTETSVINICEIFRCSPDSSNAAHLSAPSLRAGCRSPANIRASILLGSRASVVLVVVNSFPPTFSSSTSMNAGSLVQSDGARRFREPRIKTLKGQGDLEIPQEWCARQHCCHNSDVPLGQSQAQGKPKQSMIELCPWQGLAASWADCSQHWLIHVRLSSSCHMQNATTC